ncbi:agmatine deiminase family protein [Streptomyces sp. NBC_01264]|uniref:agmatine deiminase family protein n=1 Tax=Streptomyces sp. NBC_01264 TaxID=2903804 RepID=UPI00224C7C7C|nr:agmatine deiminase family protein [Streptomyces sp. NBC_01264]MCX4775965.1 agmatine deiminase family protein [Streptomyces sp. NBC_01264]
MLSKIQADIAKLAKEIAKYEQVIMCADGSSAESTARSMCGSTVTVISSVPVSDCWMRDTGPLFRVDGAGGLDAIGLNFNAWGENATTSTASPPPPTTRTAWSNRTSPPTTGSRSPGRPWSVKEAVWSTTATAR